MEISIEVVTDADIAAVIDKDGGFKIDIGSDRTKELAEDGVPVGFEILWRHLV
ncbi:hypothetical protein BDV23DRAFT_145015 [Aspergillus alliaceus]|uniref:Uncharacterized protein n=1 Tax=Petromyces alliaceus TaxID=209559 RepID=A0A5N7CMH5_PETAA|nr:hypothetical protein BDV23DRAFT_145015 [Aspergillus alliaceus]